MSKPSKRSIKEFTASLQVTTLRSLIMGGGGNPKYTIKALEEQLDVRVGITTGSSQSPKTIISLLPTKINDTYPGEGDI